MTSEGHAAWLMRRASPGARTQAIHRAGQGEDERLSVTTDDVVAWGTSGGATVLGLDAVGTLAPGMAADLAIYALDDPRYFGLHDLALGPVSSGGRPRLKAMFVGGEQVVANDVPRGIDLAELRAEARQAVRRLTT